MGFDQHVHEYRKQMERKTERFQNSFNDRMMKTALNQMTRDRHCVMNFITSERDEKKRESLWKLYRHLSIFVELYDGCDAETRKKPSYYRACQLIWKMMQAQKEGGRKIFLIGTTSPCYGFDTEFYSYQITIKGVNGNHLELLNPFMERLQAKCLLGDLNSEPIVPFSPLSAARLQELMNVSEEPEPQTRDESLVGQPLVDLPLEGDEDNGNQTTPIEAGDGFDNESNGSWFDREALVIIETNQSRQGKPDPIVTKEKYIVLSCLIGLCAILIYFLKIDQIRNIL